MTVECFNQSGSSPPPADRQAAVREATAELYGPRVALLRRRGLRPEEAREAVAAGTIRALSTLAIPTVPTLTWFAAVDRSAFIDELRRRQRARTASGAMVNWQVIEDQAALPAKGNGVSVEYDPDEAAYGDGGQPHRHEYVRLPDDDNHYPRYLPAPPPHVDLGQPDSDIADVDIELLAKRAGVTAEDIELLTRNFAGESWANIAKGMSMRRATIRARAGRALRALHDAARD